MTTYLDEVVDPTLLGEMIDQGYVQVRYHPDYPYAIYCYTKQAMFDRKWNDVTKKCRGLIVNETTGEVLARPFEKFFNLGEPDAPTFNPDDWVTAYDKVDGSLGIAYDTPDGPAIATKGSFVSEQALKATELLRELYPGYQHDDTNTDLFEIIYPENRIVLDYGKLEGLMYLGSVDIDDGSSYWNGMLMTLYGIPKNMALQFGTYAGVMSDLDLHRKNAEGFVIFNDYTGERLKVKQEDYIELHRVMTGLNEKQLWEWLSQGKKTWQILTDLPEELHGWAYPYLNKTVDEFNRLVGGINSSYAYHKQWLPDRKIFAEKIKEYPPLAKSCLFLMADMRQDRAEELIWKALKP
jgi:RNA ligase